MSDSFRIFVYNSSFIRLSKADHRWKDEEWMWSIKEWNTIMATLTVNVDNEKDLPVLKEILNRFGLKYKVDKQAELTEEGEVLYKRFKKTFKEIKDWEAGKVKLQPAKAALAEIEAELDNEI